MTTGTTEGPETTSPHPAGGGTPVLSVVLPVLNEARDLGPLLTELRAQTPPPGGFEVIVADGGSTDGTRELVEERGRVWDDLRLLENPERRSGPGRNVGAWAARGEYIMFLDGHCRLPHRDVLATLVGVFASRDPDCVCRPQPLTSLGEGGWTEAVVAARSSPLGHKPGSEVFGGVAGPVDPGSSGAAYKRSVFETLGGYDERFDACEDVEFNHRVMRAGHTAWLDPAVAVAYRARSGPGPLLRQMFRYGRGRARLMARHPETAPATLLGLSVAVLAALAFPLFLGGVGRLVLLGLGAAYLLALLVEGVRVGPWPRGVLRTPACLAAIHAGLLLGFWRGLLDAPRFRGPMPIRRDPRGEGRHVPV